MNDRKHNYSEAAKYMLKIIDNKDRGLEHLASAEKLKQIVKNYQSTGKADVKSIPAQLTPDILFGMPEAEKLGKIEELVSIYR